MKSYNHRGVVNSSHKKKSYHEMKAKKTYHDKAHRVWKNYINPYQYIEHLRSNNTIYECKYNPIFYSSSYNIANNMTKQIYVKQTKLNVSKPLHRNFLCRKRAHCMPKVSDVMSKLKYLWEWSNISVWTVMKEKDFQNGMTRSFKMEWREKRKVVWNTELLD